MDQAESAGDQRIGQLEIELFNLRRQHQSLVDDGAAGERGDIECLLVLDIAGGNLVLGAAADAIEQALESILVQPGVIGSMGPAHEHLLNIRLRGARFAAHRVAVDRRIAPAENSQALFLGNPLKNTLALQAAVLFHGKKAHGHAIGARFRQLHAQFAAFAQKKCMGNLDQNARAVARLRVASGRAAMGEVDEHLKALADDLVALFALDAGNQPHAAGIVFIPWMIESLR